VRARRRIDDEAYRYRFTETGGGLFGWETATDVVVVLAAGPGPRAEHHLTSYVADREHLGEQIEMIHDASGGRCRFVGTWHTHPRGRAAPSPRDTATAAGMANEAEVRLPSPVLLIKATLPVLRSRVGLLSAFRWDRAKSSPERCLLITHSIDMSWANDRMRHLVEV
jgi:integrative and conjugative element protein (TIGR02256 family)